MNAQTMVSQYVELHAEGFYRNEVTGTESGAPISLYAITDVMMREGGKVNINLLTHLEYQRVVYLVKVKKMKVAAAKEQAQKEVLAMLNITDNKGFGSSEDLSVVGSTDADGALLAFSVLFQGNRTEAQLTSLLQGVVSDLKEDGKWDDEDTKTAIADWAEAQDLGGKLTTIRGHVADWKLGSVPNFEKYVRNFWYSNYGLGGCSLANEGKVAKNKNTNSENKDVYFICKNNAWQTATETEKDTYDYENDRPWGAGNAGEIRNGALSNTAYVYVDEWREATPFEKDTYDYENNRPWVDGALGDKKTGSVSGDIYVFDGEWRLATTPEINYGLCNSINEGDVSDDGIYTCMNGIWINVIIDDFEDGDAVAQNIDNAYWYVATSWGSSLSNTRNEELNCWEMIFLDGTNHYAAMTGISGITPGSNLNDPPVYEFVALGFEIFVGTLSSCTAIQYDYKGSGHYMRSLVDGVTPDIGYDHYSEVQDKSDAWKTVTISTMNQPVWVPSSNQKNFSWEKVKRIEWYVDQSISSENLGAEFAIDNVKCIR